MIGMSRIKNYIEADEFHLDIFYNRIHVMNYEKILSLSDEKIVLQIHPKKYILYGKNFSLNKMYDDELLIEGILTKVEVES